MDSFDRLDQQLEENIGTDSPDDYLSQTENVDEAMTVANSLTGAMLRDLLRNRNFVPLWIGQLVSYIGDQFILIAVITVITSLSQRPDGTSDVIPLVMFAISVAAPQILFGLISGVLVDKQDRKWTMIGSDLARAVTMFALLLVNREPDRMWIIYVSMFVFGSAQMLFYPARASALAAIMPKRFLAGANALLELGFVVALIFGSGAAGILVEKLGEDAAFIFNGCAFIFSAFMIYLMRIPKRRKDSGGTSFSIVWRELRAGLAYVWGTRSMRYIMGLSILVSAALGAVTILVLDYLTKELKIGPSGFGIVIGILGVGVVVGGILIQRLSKFLTTNRLVALSMVLQAIAVGSFILNPPFAIVLLMTVLIGFSLIVSRAVLSTLTQAIPPEEYRGRVQSTFNLFSQAPLAATVGLVGALVQLTNRTLVIAGFCIILLLTAWFATNMLRGIDEAIYRGDN
ncbi:MAG: MFS transporter [Anaerolineae bacterium]|nr:MFS transporter [Anaerolineae bacterium]